MASLPPVRGQYMMSNKMNSITTCTENPLAVTSTLLGISEAVEPEEWSSTHTESGNVCV